MKLHDAAYLMKYSAFAAGLANGQYSVTDSSGYSSARSLAQNLAEDPDAYIKQVGSTDPDFSEMVHDAAAVVKMFPSNTNWYTREHDSGTVESAWSDALRQQAEACTRAAAAIIAGSPATAAASGIL